MIQIKDLDTEIWTNLVAVLTNRPVLACGDNKAAARLELFLDGINRTSPNYNKIFSAYQPRQLAEWRKNQCIKKAITNKISRLVAKYNIKTVHIPQKKNIHMLRPVKDDLGLKVPGVYRIPCECGKRCKEHIRHVRLKHPVKSAVAEHNFNTGHRIDFSSTSMLDKTTGYMDRLVKQLKLD
jgi:hypothetical protein